MIRTQTSPPFRTTAEDGRSIIVTATREVIAQSGPAMSVPPRVGPWTYSTADGRPVQRTGKGEYLMNPEGERIRLTSDDPWQPE